MTPRAALARSAAALRATESLRDRAVEQQRQVESLGPRIDAVAQALRAYEAGALAEALL